MAFNDPIRIMCEKNNERVPLKLAQSHSLVHIGTANLKSLPLIGQWSVVIPACLIHGKIQ